jgi:hypothetical protein
MIDHQVPLKDYAFLSEYGPSDCGFFHLQMTCRDFAEMPHTLFQCCHQTHEVDHNSCPYTSIQSPQTVGTTWLHYSCVVYFFKPCTKLTLHCNNRSGHLKMEHTKSLILLRHHLGNWPRSKHEKQTDGSEWETWTVPAADSVCCARVGWKINLLLTFKTAPFFCAWPVNWEWYSSLHFQSPSQLGIMSHTSSCCSNSDRQWPSDCSMLPAVSDMSWNLWGTEKQHY